VADVTFPDDSPVTPSDTFIKTWRLRNSGTCTWTSAYRLVFMGGSDLSSPESIPLPASVAPGQEIDLSLTLRAPSRTGTFQAYWLLQDPSGRRFGVGLDADRFIWVKIRAGALPVTPTATPVSTTIPGSALDFVAGACSAQWVGPNGPLPCFAVEDSSGGSVGILTRPRLEDGSLSSLPALRILPGLADRPIQGLYPDYYVLPGDRFQTSVSCEQGADLCSVLFEFAYQDEGGAEHLLWTFGEFQDGRYFSLDLDLSPLAGQNAGFILRVSPLGSSQGDRVLWVGPRIVHTLVVTDTPGPVSTLIPASSTPAPSDTPTATALPPTPLPTSGPAPQPNPPSVFRQIIDALIAWLRQLLGG